MKKLTIVDVEKYLKDNNCKLISEIYINNNIPLIYIASCGHKITMCLKDIKVKNRFTCSNCNIKNYNDKIYNKNFLKIKSKMERLYSNSIKYRNDFDPNKEDLIITCSRCNVSKSSKYYYNFPGRESSNNKKTRCKTCDNVVQLNKRNMADKTSIIKQLLKSARTATVRRNKLGKDHTVDISVKDIENIIERQNNRCVYSGIEFEWNNNSSYQYKPSIDRIDSSLGYIKNNIQLVSININKMKNSFNETEFLEMIKNVYEYKFLK